MTKSTIIFGVAGLLSGAILGYIVGYTQTKKKAQEDMDYLLSQKKEEVDEKPAEPEETNTKAEEPEIHTDPTITKSPDPSKIISPGPAKIAMPGKPGINYSAYSKKVEELNYKAEQEHPKDDDEESDTETSDGNSLDPNDFVQTYDERVKEDTIDLTNEFEIYKKKHKKPFYILKDGIDPEWPDIHYTEEQLFYFTVDDVLTDEDGQFVNEKTFIGGDLRKFGWFINRNMTETTVRNMEWEKDYHIKKEFTSYDDFFPGKLNEPIEEDEEE